MNIKDINVDNIRKLALKQPYASLVVYSNKIETRTWYTHYKGYVLITSSKQPYSYNVVNQISGDKQLKRINTALESIPLNIIRYNGYALGIGKLIDCRKMVEQDEDRCFVEYHPDLFCHIYEEFQPIEPFMIKNSMKWGKLTEEEINKIKFI